MEVGQIVFRRTKKGLESGKITKVARKYFYVQFGYWEYAISKVDLMHKHKDYIQNNFQVYLSEQEIIDEEEHELLSRKIRVLMGQYGSLPFTLDKLRRIKQIIEE